MIVKDEAEDIIKLLETAKDHITGWTICDTGSTDGTPRLITGFFTRADIPGRLAHHEWVNFGHNRQLCLQEAVQWSAGEAERLGGGADAPGTTPHVCGYLMFLDADQPLVVARPGATLKAMGLSEDAYYMVDNNWGTEFSNIRLVSTRVAWRWVGAVHEYVERADGGPTAKVVVAGIHTLHSADGGRGGDRYARDAQVLEGAVRDNPLDARAHFYLANTYRALNRSGDAIRHYTERIRLGGWQEERYVSALNIAMLARAQYEKDGSVPDGVARAVATWDSAVAQPLDPLRVVVAAYVAASALLPARPEAWLALAALHRERLRDHAACYAFASAGVAQGPPSPHALFVESDSHRFGLLDEQCTCAYYVGRHREGLAACALLQERLRAALDGGGLDPGQHTRYTATLARTADNAKYYHPVVGSEGGDDSHSTCGNPDA